MHVIATAGHVDHGKSSLVKALTGIDPDRLEEEKRRGLTIDLGFAWVRLPSGQEVGIVDVPGHERFIKNMLAGVGATDLAMFVVAANEGWQPQSQEHLDILDLLGFQSGIVVITKSDLVVDSQLDDVIDDVSLRIQETSLKRSPFVAVSVKTGEGLEQLTQHLEDLVSRAEPTPDLGRPRLWIDRSFSIKGSGTVVTGTLVGGSLEKDQEVEVVNKQLRARIRSIQNHQSEVSKIGPGNRTALNLVSLAPEAIVRGDVLTRPGSFRTTDGFVVKLRFLDLGFNPTGRGSFKAYLGSAEFDCMMTFVGPPPPRGGEGHALLRLKGSLAVASFGDRIILRDSGRRQTLAGGKIVEPFVHYFGSPRAPDAVERAQARAAAEGQVEYLEVLLREVDAMRVEDALSITGLSRDSLPGVKTRTFNLSHDVFADLGNKIEDLVRTYQSQNPLEPGIPRVQIEIGMRGLSEELVDLLVEEKALVAEGAYVRTPDHRPQTDTPEATELLQIVDDSGFSPPLVTELSQTFDPSLIRSLIREERLVQIDSNTVFTRTKIDQLHQLVISLVEKEGPFTVARFRDAAGTSRKYAVPLLEYLDSQGITKREGDLRSLGESLR